MTIKGRAYIVGAYEHPLRKAPHHSVAQLHAEAAKGAIEDAGLSKDDIDGYFCAGDAPGGNVWSMANYLNLDKLEACRFDRYGRMLLSRPYRPRCRINSSGQMQRGADYTGRSPQL